MERKTEILLTVALAAAAGIVLAVRFKRADGSSETLDNLEEVTVTARRPILIANVAPIGSARSVIKDPDISGQSLAERNNNPGNLRSWPNTPVAKGYAVFPTLLAGARASFINLHTYMTVRNLVTLRAIISRWAPESENPTNSYIDTVAKSMRVSPDQKLLYSTHAQQIMPAMWRVEAGVKFWNDSLVAAAYRAAGR